MVRPWHHCIQSSLGHGDPLAQLGWLASHHAHLEVWCSNSQLGTGGFLVPGIAKLDWARAWCPSGPVQMVVVVYCIVTSPHQGAGASFGVAVLLLAVWLYCTYQYFITVMIQISPAAGSGPRYPNSPCVRLLSEGHSLPFLCHAAGNADTCIHPHPLANYL